MPSGFCWGAPLGETCNLLGHVSVSAPIEEAAAPSAKVAFWLNPDAYAHVLQPSMLSLFCSTTQTGALQALRFNLALAAPL